MITRGALLAGIDNYPGDLCLNGCVANITELNKLLKFNADADGSKNFDVTLLPDAGDRMTLRSKIEWLFQRDLETVLFYFAGHGCLTDRGAALVTPDGESYDEGVLMDEVLTLANRSAIKNKIIIIDSCHSGAFGRPFMIGGKLALVADGLTIISASSSNEYAYTGIKHTLFSGLLIDGLKGGAADIGGNITPGSIFAYIDRSLGFTEQRPQFISNVGGFMSLRTIKPLLSRDVLEKITEYFRSPNEQYPLDPSYEDTNCEEKVPRLKDPLRCEKNVEILTHLQAMTSQGLVEPCGEKHMYFAAMNSKSCRLTPLGKHYWELARKAKT